MAKPKKKPFIQVELSLGGLFGLGVVSFCIFLWMFLFGIWAGQTVLQPGTGGGGTFGFGEVASSLLTKGKAMPWKKAANSTTITPITATSRDENDDDDTEGPAGSTIESKGEPLAGRPAAVTATPENSSFSLQIATVNEQKEAIAAVLRWRARGQDAFFLEPEGSGEKGYRVFIGNFENLRDANALAAKLEDNGQPVKSFITLVGATRQRRP